jgi:hypothetical protein
MHDYLALLHDWRDKSNDGAVIIILTNDKKGSCQVCRCRRSKKLEKDSKEKCESMLYNSGQIMIPARNTNL